MAFTATSGKILSRTAGLSNVSKMISIVQMPSLCCFLLISCGVRLVPVRTRAGLAAGHRLARHRPGPLFPPCAEDRRDSKSDPGFSQQLRPGRPDHPGEPGIACQRANDHARATALRISRYRKSFPPSGDHHVPQPPRRAAEGKEWPYERGRSALLAAERATSSSAKPGFSAGLAWK